MPATLSKVGHVAGHFIRWAWLIALYFIIVSYTFGAIGAWQFQDRIGEVAGDRAGSHAIRQQLVQELRQSLEAQVALEKRLARLDASVTSFGKYVGGIGEALTPVRAQPGQVLQIKDVAPEVLDFIRTGELRQRIDALKNDLKVFDDRADRIDIYRNAVGRYLRGGESEQAAVVLLAEYLAADNFRSWVATPFFYFPGQEDVPRQLATWNQGHLTLLLTLLMGALGSLLYVSRAYLEWAFKGARLTEPAPLPFSWFILRPMFGMITALAILTLINAWQHMSFASDAPFPLEEGRVNPFLIGFIAIIAGLMSWQALELIESLGERWLKSAQRRDLWATGLRHALAVRTKTVGALAEQIGRSQRQVERWMLLKDKVIPEMQDRIAAWLEASRAELFGDQLPQPLPERPSLRASKALQEAGIEAAALTRVVDASEAEVKAWLAGAKPVPPAAQDVIADLLGRPIVELFEAPPQPQTPPPAPSAGGGTARLDTILAGKGQSAESLSEHFAISLEVARGWVAGSSAVPLPWRTRIAQWLEVGEDRIDWVLPAPPAGE